MPVLELSSVVDAIIGMGVGYAWEKAKRREAILALLKRFKLNPGDVPSDFDGVYVYTLIEYGVFKPKPILDFFRDTYIREAFHEAFRTRDMMHLDREAQSLLERLPVGHELRRMDIDPRREFERFRAVFNEIVDRTRSLVQVKQDQKLEDIYSTIHQSTTEILEGLERLEKLDRAVAGKPEGVQYGQQSELARQMRGWFDTLGYRFERYSLDGPNYFQWIIEVPARRGYDRIMVRGVQGEADMNHLLALQKSMGEQMIKEGWLVATRRVSQAARLHVAKPEHRTSLFCYTFDELVDENADFSKYLGWLEAEIKRRSIDKIFVPLACRKEEFDPTTGEKIGQARYDEHNGWIDGYIDRWLDDPAKEHISVLGEFGTGKTWFALHYAWVSLQKYREAKARGVQRPRLPVVIPLRDYAKAVSVESLFSEFFFHKHEIPLPGYSAFEQLNRMGKLLLIFDGFDEMAAKVDRQKMINNFWELGRVVVPGAKAILTCRTEHFPEAQEGRALLSAELQASTAALTGQPPQFEVLELEKFSDAQIREVMLFRGGATAVERVMRDSALLDLARRPVMTEFILEALPDIESGKPVDLSRVYLYAVRRKMERDITEDRTFTSLADKLYFLCELSWEMLSTDKLSLNYRLFPERLRRLFGNVVQEQKDLDHWHFDMMGQTMLIRNADGDYTPAHRSLLEFFVAYKFAAELGVLADDFVEVAQEQSYVGRNLTAQDYRWSTYFQREREGETVLPIPPLRAFIRESVNQVVGTLGKQPLTKAVVDLMQNMLITEESVVEDTLLGVIDETRHKNFEQVGYLGGNVVTILLRRDPLALKGIDLAYTNLRYANCRNADLTGCTMQSSDLQYVDFQGAVLECGDFRGADLRNAQFGEMGVVNAVDFNPNSTLLAMGGEDARVHVWDLKTGKETISLQGHTGAVTSVCWSSSGQMVVSGDVDGTICWWDVVTGKQISKYNLGSNVGISVVCFEHDTSSIMVSAREFHNIVHLDINRKYLLPRKFAVAIQKYENVPYFSGDVWISCYRDTASASELFSRNNSIINFVEIRRGDDRSRNKFTLSPGHSLIDVRYSLGLIAVARGSKVALAKLRPEVLWPAGVDIDEPATSLALSPSGSMLATGSSNAEIKVWDVRPFIEGTSDFLGSKAENISESIAPGSNTSASTKEQDVYNSRHLVDMVPNPNFGNCVLTIAPKQKCTKLLIAGARGLNVTSPTGSGSLAEWLAERGAIV